MTNREDKKKITGHVAEDGLTRREALGRMGYAAFASTTMFLLLNNPTKVHASSLPSDPGDDPFPGGTKSGEAKKTEDPWNNEDDPWK